MLCWGHAIKSRPSTDQAQHDLETGIAAFQKPPEVRIRLRRPRFSRSGWRSMRSLWSRKGWSWWIPGPERTPNHPKSAKGSSISGA